MEKISTFNGLYIVFYTLDEIQDTYQHVHDLLVTKYIIRNYSINNEDIRKNATAELDLSTCREVLELGCGYGFFLEPLNGRLHPDAIITGIDLVENNREAYLHTIATIGYNGKFIRDNVEIVKDYKDSYYDLIIACYSLYFFPHILNHIARILKPGGLFITITHSKESLKELIELIKSCTVSLGIESSGRISLQGLIMSFSSENGYKILAPYFPTVDMIEYKNSMIFSYEHVDDCIYYIEKKRQLLYKEVLVGYPDKILDLEMCLSMKVYEHTKEFGKFVITKDDAIFICRL